MELYRQAGFWHLNQLLVAVLLATMLAGCAGKPVKAYAPSGVEREIFRWGFWSGTCQPRPFTIKITNGPQYGVVDIGRGTMVIGKTSADGARMACEGRVVANKVVKYTAQKGFKGTDRFRLTIYSSNSAPRLFDMEVDVY